MVATAETVEWIQVRNEVEALMLEYSLIKQHRPRFNVRLRDDKSYPFLAVTLDEEWPRAMVMRGRKRKGVRYFGPYAHAYAIRETLDLLLRTFPIRTCSDNKFDQHQRLGRPCLLFHIEKCSGPCVGEIDQRPYTAARRGAARLPRRRHRRDRRAARAPRCAAAADDLEFERAARLRDRLAAVRKAIERQQMVAERNEDIDVIGIAEDELEAAVQVFYVRRGRVVGRKGFVVDKVEDLDARRARRPASSRSCTATSPPLGVPKQVLVPVEPDDLDVYEEWLTEHAGLPGRRSGCRSGATSATLHETVTRNAKEEFTRHRLRRATDHNSRARALNELQDALGLPEAPLRIECYDMSHIQGTDYVGSMVVMEDGLPEEVRVPAVQGQGRRRQRRLRRHGGGAHPPPHRLPRRARPAGRRARPGKFAYPPQLLLVDGGKGQLAVAERVRARARPRRGDPGGVAGQAVRGGLRAGPGRPGRDPPPVRGAVPAAAHPRRGPPLRHHVPPRAAGQAHDDERARRHPRPRARRARSGW